MSTKTSKDPSLQSTKQMLDELDALMEKMLALPVTDPEEAAPFPAEVVKPPSLTPTLSATLTMLPPPAAAPVSIPEPEPSHPVTNPPHLSMPASLPIEPAAPPSLSIPVPEPEPLTNEIEPPSRMAELEPLLAEVPAPGTPVTTQWVYLPLLWLNQGFDRVATSLGLGTALRGPAGRMVLGMSGIALMLAAGAWLLKDWLGWH